MIRMINRLLRNIITKSLPLKICIIPIYILKAVPRWGALRLSMPYATRRICLSGKSSYQLTKMGFGIILIPILKAVLRWGALRPRMPYATRRICLSGKSSYQITKMRFGIIIKYPFQIALDIRAKIPHKIQNLYRKTLAQFYRDTACQAYTLLELSIVLIIMGFTTFTFLGVVDSFIKVSNYKTTYERLDSIELRMLKYLKENKGLPCPASQTTSFETSGYGEDGDACASASLDELCPNATAYQVLGVTVGYQGSVPVISMGLPADYMYDGWGRRFTYYVSSKLNCTNGTDLNSGFYSSEDDLPSVDNKSDAVGVLHSYDKNAYILLSHGRNGYGAYTKSGVKVSELDASDDELENSDLDNNFVYNYFKPVAMDDILRFKTKWQLMLDFEDLDYVKRYPSSECNCVSTSVTKFDDMCF
jgi:hypothetical protein